MSDEPLGDDSKPRSYDVTFSNPLFDFNDDSTLCYDNPLFDEEFDDISSLDPPESTPVIDETTLLVTPLPDSKKFSLREPDHCSGGGPVVVNGGVPPLTAVVYRRWPPLTAAIDQWFGGGSGDNWQATWHQSQGDTWHSNHEVRGIVAAGTRSKGLVRGAGGRISV
ncbi:hypothetical protein Tco_0359546 [Tanacetum coccineum]